MLIISFFLFTHLIGGLGQEMEEDNWGLQMVHNVRWNHSKSFVAVRREKTTEQSHKGAMHLGVNVPSGMEDAEMSFFYGIGGQNMLIEFMEAEDGVPYCKIGVLDNLLSPGLLPFEAYKKICSFERKRIYKKRELLKSQNPRLYGFCDLHVKPHWQNATGIYNRPFKTPECIYDFHKAATVHNEYEFFRYCAKGYYYHGMNYIDYPNSNIAKLRKAWLLYLAEGQLECKISGNVEADARLLAKGYTVELSQYNYPQRLNPEMKLCPRLSATLTSYNDKRRDGKFFYAAMVGATQLDGQFEYSYKEPMRFWDEATYKNEYERMSLDERACYLQYHKQLLREDGRYGLELKVTHYCNERGMRTSTSFDVSIGPEQVPDGIHEDSGLVIDLTTEHLRRTTGQTLCSNRWGNATESGCKAAVALNFLSDHNLKDNDKCTYPHECPAGSNCWGEPRVCHPGTKSPAATPDCKGQEDGACRDDEICTWNNNWDEDVQTCRKMHFREDGESCCCKHDKWEERRECFPGFECDGPTEKVFGVCRKRKS